LFNLESFIFAFEKNIEAVDFIVSLINTQNYKEDFSNNFSDLFKKYISEEKIKLVFKELRNKYGNIVGYKTIDLNKGIFEIEFEKVILTLSITLDGGKINSLYFSNPRTKNDFSIADLNEINSEKSVLIKNLNDNKIIFEFNKDLPLEISSLFKLYLLMGVLEKENDLSKIIKINENYYSIPPSILYYFPKNSSVTLYTYLFLMISQSDNTATDHIISFVGEDKIPLLLKKYGNLNYEMNIPFLYTSDIFRIFYSTENLKSYLNSNAGDKQLILKKLRNDKEINSIITNRDLKKIEDILLKNNDYNTKIGWFASASDICRFFEYAIKSKEIKTIREILAANTEISVNSLISDDIKEKYKYIGGKLGSKFGVVSVGFLIITKKDTPYCFSAIFNSKEPITYESIYMKVISPILNNPEIYNN
jgi:hypothetical protein